MRDGLAPISASLVASSVIALCVCGQSLQVENGVLEGVWLLLSTDIGSNTFVMIEVDWG